MIPPVLRSEEVRKNYDTQWMLYPWEHPDAYWLRASDVDIVCTRCGAHMTDERNPILDLDEMAEAFVFFVDEHLKCPLGLGFNASASPVDPLFDEEE